MKTLNTFVKLLICAFVALLFVGLSAQKSQAQIKTIKLHLNDDVTQRPITEATATLINLKDSSVVEKQVSDKTGLLKFQISGAGKYSIIIDKTGYKKETCYSTFGSADKDSYMYFTLGMKPKV